VTTEDEALHLQLRAHARGLHGSTETVELLIAHRRWLRRADFRDQFLFTGPDFDTEEVTACIDWPTAVIALDRGRLPCSGSESRMLRIAAGIGEGVPVDLREAFTELDAINTALVARAVIRAAGHCAEQWTSRRAANQIFREGKGKETTHSLPCSTYSALGGLQQDPCRAAESPAEVRT
jgi:hypothetical protein